MIGSGITEKITSVEATGAQKPLPVTKKLKNCGFALFENTDAIDDLLIRTVADESFGGFVEWFVTQTKSSIVHRHECAGFELEEGINGFLGIHVDIAFGRGLVSADGKEGNFDRQPLTDFCEALEPCTVAAVKNRPSCVLNMETTKSSVAIVEQAGSPMSRWGQSDFQIAHLEALPLAKLLDTVETKAVNKSADMFGDDNGLVAGNSAEGFAIQVVEMGMGYQHEVDRRQIMNFDSRLADAFDDFEPLRPVWVDEDAVLGGLNEK